MERARLGRTELRVPRLGLGTYHLISDLGVARDEAIATIRRAVALGIEVIDTAPLYGAGEAEELVARAIGTRNGVQLWAKVGRFADVGFRRRHADAYRDARLIRAQFERSLWTLRRETVDVLLVHEADWPVWWPDNNIVAGPVLEVAQALRSEGRVRHIGISARDSAATIRLCRSGAFDLLLYVHYYNLVWQEAGSTVLPEAERVDLGISVGAALGQGLLIGHDEGWFAHLAASRRPDVPPGMIERIRGAQECARQAGLSMVELGLRFLLSDPRVGLVLVGPASVRELEEDVSFAERGPLPADVLSDLRALREIPPGRWD